jgi:hypothetical protein
MLLHLRTSVRALLLVTALAFAIDAPSTRATAAQPHPSAQTKANTHTPDRDEFPIEGALIVVGIVGVVIVLAWVCSRFGDSR